MSKSFDAFLSYASSDIEFARELAVHLSSTCNIYYQPRDGELGAEWQASIVSAMKESKGTVVLASKYTNNAFYQKAEIEFALNLCRNVDERHVVIPVFLPGVDPYGPELPFGLALLHGIHMQNGITLGEVGALIEARIGSLGASDNAQPVIDTSTSIASSVHYLLSYPVGPLVRDLVFRALPEAYAELAGGAQLKPLFALVNQSLKEAASLEGSVPARISLAELPALTHVGAISFWTDVFYNLAAKGPRALAAMLLAVPDELFSDEAKQERTGVLKQLATYRSIR